MRSPLILLFCLLLCSFGHSQTSIGNRFWVAYMENLPLFANDDPVFTISVDATSATTVTISRPANGWSQTYSAAANSLTNITLPNEVFYTIGEQIVDDFGFLIQTDNPVKIIAFHNRAYFSESTGILPESTLGSEYMLSTYLDSGGFSPSEFVVVATQNNTEIEITPSANTTTGNPADTPFTVTLDEGQTYQVKSSQDLTGTRVRSLGGESIAVFGGAQQANVSLCNGADNHIYEQNWPVDIWDDLFYFVPFKNQGGDVVQIVAAEDNTTVFFDCNEITTLDQGEYYNGLVAQPTVITSTADVAVMQLNESQGCNPSGIGDPNMLQVHPIRYKTSEARFFANGNTNGLGNLYFTVHAVNIVTKTADIANIQLDGNSITDEFEAFPADPLWSYAQIQLNSTGNHQITSSTPFQAYSYGFGDYDAYSSTLGFEEVQEEEFACLEIEVEGLFCVDSILTFSTTSNLEIASWDWNFGDGNGSMEEAPSHSYDNTGSYTVTVDVVFENGGMASASLDLEIFDCPNDPCGNTNPNIEIAFDMDACAGEVITFTYNTDISVSSQIWDFGNGFTSTDVNGITSFVIAGNYTITLILYDQFNCEYAFVQELEIPDCDPCANSGDVELTYDGVLCIDSTITFNFPLNFDPDTNPFLFYEWYINGQLTQEINPSIVLNAPGPLSVEFLASDFLNGCDFFGGIDLIVEDCDDPCNDVDPLVLIVDGDYCVDSFFNFTYQVPASLTSINWQASDGQTGNGNNFNIAFDAPGIYSVQIIAVDIDGCTYEESITVEIEDCSGPCDDLDPVDILISAETCVDSLISFDVGTTASVIEFAWTFSTGQTFNVIAPELSFDAPGIYSATLVATDVDGCIYETTEEFEVEVCEEVPCQDLSDIEILVDGALCVGENITFEFQTTANLVSTFWELDNGENTNQNTFSFTPNQADNYILTFTAEDIDGCNYLEEIIVVVEDCTPACNADLLIEVEGIFCDSTLLDFSLLLDQQAGSANVDLVSYIWDISNGSTFNEAQFSTQFLDAGSYNVFVLAEASDGCIYSEELILEINDCTPENICGLGFPNAFSPNDDGFNDEFRAYFECLPLAYNLQIFDRWGELVFETNDPNDFWNGKIKNKSLGIGVYVWVAEYTNNIGETVQIYGDVMLLR